ncbi:MAG: hypothetical protein ACRDI2_24485 [Chloroflexota bacterium]
MTTVPSVPCDYPDCGYAATEQCSRCHRVFCLKHARRWGGEYRGATCVECQAREDEQRAAETYRREGASAGRVLRDAGTADDEQRRTLVP